MIRKKTLLLGAFALGCSLSYGQVGDTLVYPGISGPLTYEIVEYQGSSKYKTQLGAYSQVQNSAVSPFQLSYHFFAESYVKDKFIVRAEVYGSNKIDEIALRAEKSSLSANEIIPNQGMKGQVSYIFSKKSVEDYLPFKLYNVNEKVEHKAWEHRMGGEVTDIYSVYGWVPSEIETSWAVNFGAHYNQRSYINYRNSFLINMVAEGNVWFPYNMWEGDAYYHTNGTAVTANIGMSYREINNMLIRRYKSQSYYRGNMKQSEFYFNVILPVYFAMEDMRITQWLASPFTYELIEPGEYDVYHEEPSERGGFSSYRGPGLNIGYKVSDFVPRKWIGYTINPEVGFTPGFNFDTYMFQEAGRKINWYAALKLGLVFGVRS